MKFYSKPIFKYVLVGVWLLNTLALAGWLYIFSFRQTQRIAAIRNETIEQATAYHRMLISESLVLSFCLLVGGFFLSYYIYLDSKRTKKVRSFFLTFSHELKTPLASLQLQTESLHDALGDSEHREVINHLVADTNRLSLHLENSLALAEGSERKFFPEKLNFKEVIEALKNYWPNLKVQLIGDATIKADRRTFESILKNILENSYKHGDASEVVIKVDSSDSNGMLEIRIVDNGRGFNGEYKTLGKLLERQASTSGSGIGLHLVRELTKSLGGNISFPRVDSGFAVKLDLPGII
ncbi:MAG: HAMP domain-containing histidine kinase [Bdellovibrionales bacterium]|nr:HAMP domain-containing histidine kinase [Bdellovibrionales bacterium]